MKLFLKRKYFKDTYTIGNLYIDGIFLCNTLEDKRRELNVEPKVYGKTAIPEGNYRIIFNYSPHYQKKMPLLVGVPNFEGVRIHAGNTEEDTEGCILVGKNNVVGKVTNSKYWFSELMESIANQKNLEIEIA